MLCIVKWEVSFGQEGKCVNIMGLLEAFICQQLLGGAFLSHHVTVPPMNNDFLFLFLFLYLPFTVIDIQLACNLSQPMYICLYAFSTYLMSSLYFFSMLALLLITSMSFVTDFCWFVLEGK